MNDCCDNNYYYYYYYCGSGMARREFIKMIGTGAALIGTPGMAVMAGPFEPNEYLQAIPTDKKLDPAWVRALYARGDKQTYSNVESLKHIGMPVGGLFAGTVYLGGDGRLWLWDIFNRDQNGILPRAAKMPAGIGVGGNNNMRGMNYLYPAPLTQPFEVGFALAAGGKGFALNGSGFEKVTFEGRYPIGRVTYQDDDCPVKVGLEAFSPFCPLNLEDSSLPAVVMSFTLTNQSNRTIEAVLTGLIENPICLDSQQRFKGRRQNRIVHNSNLTALVCSAAAQIEEFGRADILFEDFERKTYENWTTQGDAFGTGPISKTDIPDYQGNVGGQGRRVVNSHATAPGDSVGSKDAKTGKLISKPFTINRKFINLFVGGGAHKNTTCVNVVIKGNVVASVTGQNDNRMQPQSLSVEAYEGKQAHLEIIDQLSGDWGNIGVDHIVFSDKPANAGKLHEQRDFGTMTLGLIGQADEATASGESKSALKQAEGMLGESLIGRIGRKLSLQPGASTTVDFMITWHFPNFYSRGCSKNPWTDHERIMPGPRYGPLVGHHYASRFDSAYEVAQYLAEHFDHLTGQTRTWVETWYDSTLPYWLLDRTMANTSTLATTTCYRFKDGRFWAWEGVGCCPGTCTHVWHYAQAPGRLFPEIERIERERVNFGIGFQENGGIGMRTALTDSNDPADDGHCGRILGVLREHQMSPDDAFLRRLWPRVRKALLFMIRHDGNADGILEGAQPNTLDAAWYGKISFVSSLYLAALRAGQQMASEVGDHAFAKQCKAIAEKGARNILETYNGEYFIQIDDPKHADAIGVGNGCYIDQIFGQTWAHWVGLGRLFDRDKQLSALRALWKYNFVPDIGPFREKFTQGRWYAKAGDAGLIMCSWPRGGKNPALTKHWQYGYFNECMSGFEYQAAAHMIWEGHDQPDILRNGLAITRAIHDRYNASLRNPYNEIECSDHYSRAMASFGVYQAVCGYEYHGPKGHIGFAPRLSPENFRCAFTSAKGWGTFMQQCDGQKQDAEIRMRWGKLRLKTLALHLPEAITLSRVRVAVNGNDLPAELTLTGRHADIHFQREAVVEAGQAISVEIS